MIILFVEILTIFIFGLILFTLIVDERKKRKRNMHTVKLKGYWDGVERRSADRLNITLEVRYIIDRRTQEAKSVDISRKGIRLLLDERFDKGTPLQLEIRLPRENHLIKANGEIVWIQEAMEDEKTVPKRLFNTGIRFRKFHSSNDETKLFNFISGLKVQER